MLKKQFKDNYERDLKSCADGRHDYEFYQGWDDETYTCRQCGHHYKLYYEDMK